MEICKIEEGDLAIITVFKNGQFLFKITIDFKDKTLVIETDKNTTDDEMGLISQFSRHLAEK